MARNRKQKTTVKSEETAEPLVNIPESEQLRIIKESGILNAVPLEETVTPEWEKEEQLLSPLTEEIFSATTLIIPHCFLLLMMEILIHYQYGRHPTYGAIFERMISGVPIISIFIFYTSRYKETRAMQAFFFLLSLTMGSRLVYMLNHASWITNMKQAPPLATAWVYSIVQLNLLPSVASLALIYGWIRYTGLKIFF